MRGCSQVRSARSWGRSARARAAEFGRLAAADAREQSLPHNRTPAAHRQRRTGIFAAHHRVVLVADQYMDLPALVNSFRALRGVHKAQFARARRALALQVTPSACWLLETRAPAELALHHTPPPSARVLFPRDSAHIFTVFLVGNNNFISNCVVLCL